MIKILLTSDLHLGDDADINHASSEDRFVVLSGIAEKALSHDLLLISGDLFHNFDENDNLIEIVNKCFTKLRESGTKIAVLPGECEISDGEISKNLKKIDTDIIFEVPEKEIVPVAFEIEGEKIVFYPHSSPDETALDSLRRNDESGFHLGVFHINLSEQNMKNNLFSYIQKDDRLDFYALGHDHNLKIFKFQNQVIAAFPGAPHIIEGNDSKVKHVLSLTVENGKMTDIKRLAVNSAKTVSLKFDCSLFSSSDDIMEKIRPYASKSLKLKLTLNGNRTYRIGDNFISELDSLFFRTEIENTSVTDIKNLINESCNENSLRGEFFSVLANEIKTSPEAYDNEIVTEIVSRFPIDEDLSAEEWICSLINA